jgi:hypothetical protein
MFEVYNLLLLERTQPSKGKDNSVFIIYYISKAQQSVFASGHSLSSIENSSHAFCAFLYEPGKEALTVIYLNVLFCFSFCTEAWLLSLYQS